MLVSAIFILKSRNILFSKWVKPVCVMPVICFSSLLTRWKSYCWALPRMFPKPWFMWKGWGPAACAGFGLCTLPLGPARLAAGQVGAAPSPRVPAPVSSVASQPVPGACLYLLHGHPPKGSLFSKEGEVRRTASQWADKISTCAQCVKTQKNGIVIKGGLLSHFHLYLTVRWVKDAWNSGNS